MDKELKKAIGVFFIGFFTFGIANLVFLYRFSDEMLTNADGKIINPMRETVLNVITFGLYGAYWSYKMGQKLDMLEDRESISISTLLCALLSVVFLRSITMSVIYYRMKLSDVGV